MQAIGTVLHDSKNHMLVLRCENSIPKKENMLVFTEDEKKIGIISDVFGPIKKPYATIKHSKSVDVEKMIGKVLYTK
jgi:rRNA processing protein Gar1